MYPPLETIQMTRQAYTEALLEWILTSNMALKLRHRTTEMMKNNTKMGLNCDIDREKHKYSSKIPTDHGYLLNMQND